MPDSLQRQVSNMICECVSSDRIRAACSKMIQSEISVAVMPDANSATHSKCILTRVTEKSIVAPEVPSAGYDWWRKRLTVLGEERLIGMSAGRNKPVLHGSHT